jgi:cytoskeletal protein CcmA (bactofilin family)
MAWFDRNPGGKKEPEREPAQSPEPVKIAPESTPSASLGESPPQTKVGALPELGQPALVGYLYKGSRVSGELTFQGPARIDGNVEGEIHCHGNLTIGEGAEVRAKISGHIVTICGRVDGNVIAKEKVELLAPARLYGNIVTPRLIITEGVVFDGDCSMGVAKQKSGVAISSNASVDKAAAVQSSKLDSD